MNPFFDGDLRSLAPTIIKTKTPPNVNDEVCVLMAPGPGLELNLISFSAYYMTSTLSHSRRTIFDRANSTHLALRPPRVTLHMGSCAIKLAARAQERSISARALAESWYGLQQILPEIYFLEIQYGDCLNAIIQIIIFFTRINDI